MLNTMSFIDAIPAFRMKQWQVIVLLFLEGLSVCRIPALTPHMTNRRMLFHKVRQNTLFFLINLFVYNENKMEVSCLRFSYRLNVRMHRLMIN